MEVAWMEVACVEVACDISTCKNQAWPYAGTQHNIISINGDIKPTFSATSSYENK